MVCSECGNEINTGRSVYEYTVDAGLDPREYSVILENVEVAECKCGRAAVIPALEALHAGIAVAVAVDPHPVRPSGVRFLRRFLGLTQKQFADLVRSSGESVSYWETGARPMSPEMDVNVRTRCLVALGRDDRVSATKLMSRGDVIELMEKLFEKVDSSLMIPAMIHARPLKMRKPGDSILDANGIPEAWAIRELEKIQNGNHGAVN